ncbi:hypothetical protein E2C01_004677 [Portunus trituberculatus]|uniref:Uncharacterized protein n=1 Tax=Portunus trituberculatus TaxID=210409 RepID=A0A5B7CRC6_PORTR|nr:hypothetical protein [Portunus trituberculatus]
MAACWASSQPSPLRSKLRAHRPIFGYQKSHCIAKTTIVQEVHTYTTPTCNSGHIKYKIYRCGETYCIALGPLGGLGGGLEVRSAGGGPKEAGGALGRRKSRYTIATSRYRPPTIFSKNPKQV